MKKTGKYCIIKEIHYGGEILKLNNFFGTKTNSDVFMKNNNRRVSDYILQMNEKCDEIIGLVENICNNKPIPHERYYNNFERFGDMLQLRNIYEELLEYFPSYKFIIFENISKRDVQKLKNELLYINARFILDDNKRNVLLNSDDIKKI